MRDTFEAKIQVIIAQSVQAIYKLELSSDEIIIEIPRESKFGDYSTNIAMRMAKDLKLAPKVIAQALIDQLSQNTEVFANLSLAGPGFINMFLQPALLMSVVPKILAKKANYGATTLGQGVKVNLEYVSANPTGDLHPGHARGAAMGDAVARIMSKAGYAVTREYYINDAGNQVTNMALSVRARYLQSLGYDSPIPADGYHGEDISLIAKQFLAEYGKQYATSSVEESLPALLKFSLKHQLLKLKEDLASFQVEFDVWTSESAIYEQGLVDQVVKHLVQADLTYEAEGALWLKSSLYGDDKDRVLIKTDGSYTYLTPDIAYHLDKFNRGFTQLVDFWGADHHGYIPRLKAALKALNYDETALMVDIIQMVRMIKDGQEFKLSKRSGQALSLRDLIEEAGVDAVRYFFVSRAADTQMDFDLDLARSQTNENPVYYAQYAHARMASILKQVELNGLPTALQLLTHPKEQAVLKQLNEFPLVVNEAALSRQPHKICNYIQKIAASFHSFYSECKVLNPAEPSLTNERLALVLATKITLANALTLIGVSAPEQM